MMQLLGAWRPHHHHQGASGLAPSARCATTSSTTDHHHALAFNGGAAAPEGPVPQRGLPMGGFAEPARAAGANSARPTNSSSGPEGGPHDAQPQPPDQQARVWAEGVAAAEQWAQAAAAASCCYAPGDPAQQWQQQGLLSPAASLNASLGHGSPHSLPPLSRSNSAATGSGAGPAFCYGFPQPQLAGAPPPCGCAAASTPLPASPGCGAPPAVALSSLSSPLPASMGGGGGGLCAGAPGAPRAAPGALHAQHPAPRAAAAARLSAAACAPRRPAPAPHAAAATLQQQLSIAQMQQSLQRQRQALLSQTIEEELQHLLYLGGRLEAAAEAAVPGSPAAAACDAALAAHDRAMRRALTARAALRFEAAQQAAAAAAGQQPQPRRRHMVGRSATFAVPRAVAAPPQAPPATVAFQRSSSGPLSPAAQEKLQCLLRMQQVQAALQDELYQLLPVR